jgi:hypothetical protein
VTTVAFIHATQASIAPTVEAFGRDFPEAEPWHLLDDRLATDADAAGGLTPPLRQRMRSLIRHAVTGGAQAVQLCCSIYGPVATEPWDVPVVGSDEQMFREVAWSKPARVGVLASMAASAEDTVRRLTEASPGTEVIGIPALDAATTGLVALEAAARPHVGEIGLFVIAQYSLSPAQPALEENLGVPVLSPPVLAARDLRRRLIEEV